MDESKKLPLSGFALKLIAIVFMTLDHIGLFLSMYAASSGNAEAMNTAAMVLRYAGRIAFPIFAFLLAEGMRYSASRGKYILRILGVYALVEIVQIILVYAPLGIISGAEAITNPLSDLLFCGLVLYCLRLPKWKKLFALLPFAFILLCYIVGVYENYYDVSAIWLPYYLRPAYSVFALLITLGFYYAFPLAYKMGKGMCEQLGISQDIFPETYMGRRLINILGLIFFFLVTVAFWGLSYLASGAFDPVYNLNGATLTMSAQSYCLLAILFLYFYSGKRGYDSKGFRYFEYAYFPVHLALLYAVFYLIFM